ncbi:MAG: 30S ribosomal protein S5 [Nanoarchaeota archaeon]|nr:30S ribosomal protein S5 [Nanoarchaeota archaeon]
MAEETKQIKETKEEVKKVTESKEETKVSTKEEAPVSEKVEEVVAVEEPKIEVDESAVEVIVAPTEDKAIKKAIERDSRNAFDVGAWQPKTGLSLQVKTGEIKDIDEILNKGLKILEPEVLDVLMPDLEKDLLLIGQSKGKFGGGQRRVFKQTQKKTPEGNKPHFATFAVVGNKNGYIGVGYGKSKETVPAREKAFRNAKLDIMKIKRGCGSWQCGCKSPHSIPFAVEGKCSSVRIILIPAPKGTGLKVEKSCARILELAGVKDVWSKSFGQTKSKINLIKALMAALNQLNSTKLKPIDYENLGIVEGKLKTNN